MLFCRIKHIYYSFLEQKMAFKIVHAQFLTFKPNSLLTEVVNLIL